MILNHLTCQQSTWLINHYPLPLLSHFNYHFNLGLVNWPYHTENKIFPMRFQLALFVHCVVLLVKSFRKVQYCILCSSGRTHPNPPKDMASDLILISWPKPFAASGFVLDDIQKGSVNPLGGLHCSRKYQHLLLSDCSMFWGGGWKTAGCYQQILSPNCNTSCFSH